MKQIKLIVLSGIPYLAFYGFTAINRPILKHQLTLTLLRKVSFPDVENQKNIQLVNVQYKKNIQL